MLSQKNIIKEYLSMLPSESTVTAWTQYSEYFLNAEIQQDILQSKDEQFQEGFLRELFVKVLGYTLHPSPGYNLITEQKNETNSKKADGAIVIPGTQVSHLRQGTQVSHLREATDTVVAAGETPAYQPAYRPFVQRSHDASHHYVDRVNRP